MKYLITGSTGFIGRNFIDYLISKKINTDDIVVLSGKEHPFIKTILYDDTYKIPKIEDVDIIFHIGAFIPKSNTDLNDVNKNTNNITFTKELLNAIKPNIKKIIYISTIDVYPTYFKPIYEKLNANPKSIYGWSKLYCEQLVINWCLENEVEYQILRLGHIYGPGEEQYKKIIPVSIQKVIKNEAPEIFTAGKEKRSYLHIEDCVRFIHKAADISEKNQITNIVSGSSVTIYDLVCRIIALAGKEINPIVHNKSINVYDSIFDNQKMVRLFGQESIPLDNGLLGEIEYMTKKIY